MKKFLIWSLILFFTSTAAFSFISFAAEKTVIATGSAAGGGDKAKDEALARAMRDAVEKAVGVYVEAETMVKNYQLLEDKIYSKVKGYVKSYEIISDNNGQGGVYEIKIKAVVATEILHSDLSALNIIKSAKGNPRIAILINEYIDGNDSTVRNVRSMLEKEFLSKDFKLVDKEQLTAIKNRDISISYDDPQKAAALGSRIGAEVVITGSASADFMEKSKPYGVSVFAYSAKANAKAIKTDTAEVIAIASADSIKRAGGRNITANEALSDCGQKLAKQLIHDIVEKWRSEVYNYVDIQVFFSQVDSEKRIAILKDLKAIRGVNEVNEKSFTNSLLELDIKVEGAAVKVIDKKIQEKMPYLKLKNKTANRLDFEVMPDTRPSASMDTGESQVITAVDRKIEEVSETDKNIEGSVSKDSPDKAE